MSRFAYTALDARGTEKSGLLDAPDVKQVAAMLKGQGLFPTDIIPQRGEPAAVVTKSSVAPRPVPSSVVRPLSSVQLRLPFLRVVGAKELAVFTRQLAT